MGAAGALSYVYLCTARKVNGPSRADIKRLEFCLLLAQPSYSSSPLTYPTAIMSPIRNGRYYLLAYGECLTYDGRSSGDPVVAMPLQRRPAQEVS
jgi:hypothetical protein